MSALQWILFALGVAGISAYAAWWYRTREDPVRGRGTAAVLRVLALSAAWLLLLNPRLPARWRPQDQTGAILLDGSFSMSRPSLAVASSSWDRALDSLPRGDRLWVFGGEIPRYIPTDSQPGAPTFMESRLAPALRAAALSGARRVSIVSDGEIGDSAAATEELRRGGLDASFVRINPPFPQVGIALVRAPAWLEEGDTADVQVEIVASQGGDDELRIEILDEDERVLASATLARPAPGRFATGRLPLSLTGRPGWHRLVARVVGDTLDLERRDDRRPFYVQMTDRPVGPVVISLHPDWEPSFLLPNLDRLTDVPATAYMLMADSLLALDGYGRVDVETVVSRAREAPLLVIHGYGANVPSWMRQLVRSAERLLVLPVGEQPFELPGWGVHVEAPQTGEWYLSPQVPASPLALSLEGAGLEELPPLMRVRAVEAGEAATPLTVQRLRRGTERAALVMGRSGTRRWAVAAGEGYWRWGFRPGVGRSLYRALWTGLGGWLLEDRVRTEAGMPPIERVVERGEALTWAAPTFADSISVVVTGEDSVAWRGATAGGDSLNAYLPPGRYEYTVSTHRSGRPAQSSRGPVEVEEFNTELLPRRAVVVEGSFSGERGNRFESGRGLAALGWPFLIVIALFCAEWAVRRMNGLS
jgi:hypothetical protein